MGRKLAMERYCARKQVEKQSFASPVYRHRFVLEVLVFALCGPASSASSESETTPAAIVTSLRNDAALTDVVFTDRANGWAVGDRGVIWRTSDGGNSWSQQNSGVTCQLRSVCFIDSRRGWIVGGESRPYARATRGVVLRTSDGGATWNPVASAMLPLLTRVKFFDENVGVAIGFGSQSQPSGVYATRDGGGSWLMLPADQSASWLAGDFLDAGTGAVAGPSGRFATIARQRVVHSPLAALSLRSFHGMRLTAPTGGWAVGDGAMIMSTGDGGRSWQSATNDLLAKAAEHFDFHAVALHGQHVWVAGSPGTRVFHTQDGGQSWQAFDTGHFAPIRTLWFVDDLHGWAAGDLGCILATRDGGCTWIVQREGGRRAALWGVFANATDVPLELIAQQGAAEGYVAAVDVLHRETENEAASDALEFAAAEAIRSAGASSADFAWQFPLPAESFALSPADLLAALNRATDGRAIEQLERHLVRQIRMWRPNVVVTRHADRRIAPGPGSGGWGRASASPQNASTQTTQPSPNSNSASILVEQLVLRAVAAAADPAEFVELSSGAGLPRWQVEKVYGVLPAGLHGDERIDTDRFSSMLGATPGDFASIPRRLVFSTHVNPPEAIELKLLMCGTTNASAAPGLFGGITLAPGSDARRVIRAAAVEDVDALRRLAARRRNLRQLLERSEGNAAWAGHVATITAGLDANAGGELLMQLADGYRANGNLDLAADTYYVFARQYPDHPLVDTALVWLVQFYASGEAAHRAAIDQGTNVRNQIAAEVDAVGARRGEGETARGGGGEEHTGSTLVAVSHSATLDNAADASPAVVLSRDDRLRRAVQLAEYFRTARPHLYAEPVMRFAEVTAQRQLGYPNEAKRYFLTVRQLPETSTWRRCAAAEEWLASPGDMPPPKPLATCRRTTARPQLDGLLDEPFWQTADTIRLRGDKSGAVQTREATPVPAGEVRLAYDNGFLYVAVCCPKFDGIDYRRDDSPRPRDADLAQHDRVELRLDLDRDYSTAYELTVDHRGWCRDACWSDANWNPRWFIAAAADDTSWTVEGAIPLAELTGDRPAARHVWAMSVRRAIPSIGYESWAGPPVSSDWPDRFGLLVFE